MGCCCCFCKKPSLKRAWLYRYAMAPNRPLSGTAPVCALTYSLNAKKFGEEAERASAYYCVLLLNYNSFFFFFFFLSLISSPVPFLFWRSRESDLSEKLQFGMAPNQLALLSLLAKGERVFLRNKPTTKRPFTVLFFFSISLCNRWILPG